jgi:hypothetical protein
MMERRIRTDDGWSGPPQPTTPPPAEAIAGRWLDESWLCGCPDCGAPLSIRRWLMSADCWQCGVSLVIVPRKTP